MAQYLHFNRNSNTKRKRGKKPSSMAQENNESLFPFSWEQNTIRNNDYNTLLNGRWLSDAIIGFS